MKELVIREKKEIPLLQIVKINGRKGNKVFKDTCGKFFNFQSDIYFINFADESYLVEEVFLGIEVNPKITK